MLIASSNGLAAGNTKHEAIIHALYEVAERDATSSLGSASVRQRAYVDIATVDDPLCAALIQRIISARAWLEIVQCPSRFGLPTYVCYLWSADFSGAMAIGAGSHSLPEIALSRAITEAAQSRLTFITGSRDDISPFVYRTPYGDYRRPATCGRSIAWSTTHCHRVCDIPAEDTAEASWLAEKITAVTGAEPLLVVLGTYDELTVVKVVCPNTQFFTRHYIPRPGDN
jgi:ribosomal protein S12 methylthiotransferase accessory factor